MVNLDAIGLNLEPNVIIAYLFALILIYLIGRVFLMPLKVVFKLLYNAFIGAIALLALNFVGSSFDFNIAINPITAILVGVLGIPGVILLILCKVVLGGL